MAIAEQYAVLNPATTEGGIEIPAATFEDIATVANNIDEVVAVAGIIDPSGNLTVGLVDGNTATIKVRGKTQGEWIAVDSVLAVREFGYVTDATAPPVLKIGNGIDVFTALPNILLSSELTLGVLQGYVDAATVQANNAGTAAIAADTARSAAVNAQTAAEADAALAQQWASAPSTTTMPGGKLSAEANADRAAAIANTSRLIDRATMAGDETAASGHLYTKRRYLGSGLATVSIPANLYSNTADKEAWIVYRKAAAGNILFQAAPGGATDLVPAQLLASGYDVYRNKTGTAGVSVTQPFSIAVPAIADGKLCLIVAGGSNDSAAKNCSITLSDGLTPVTKQAVVAAGQQVAPCWAVFDTDLDSFTAKTITATITFGSNVHRIELYWFAIEGHGGPMITPVTGNVIPVAANISRTIPALPQASRVLVAASQYGSVVGNAFSSFSANIATIRSGNSADAPDITVSNTTGNKNHVYGQGSGVATATGNFVVDANFATAVSSASLALVAYPPKTIAGGGAVTLNLMGGRNTLNVLHGEAVLYFHPDGITVTVHTPAG